MAFMKIVVIGLFLLLSNILVWADTYIRQPSIDIIHYDISFSLTDSADSISGTAKISIRIRKDGTSGMWLDFKDMTVDKLLVDGNVRNFEHRNSRMEFEFGKTLNRNETVSIEIRYHGAPQRGLRFGKNRYSSRTVFADNWPDSAHYWFPSIDHPSDKAAVDFTVTVPEKYDVVANGRLVKTSSLQDGRKLFQWTEKESIPAYCMTVGIAEFSIAHQPEAAGVQLLWYSFPKDALIANRKFAVTAPALEFFSSLIAPYPYEKLAQVESTTKLSAMENADTIFYNENLFKETPDSDEPVPHEIAHQWFGNSVTEADWDDLWLSEGFATYFEALLQEHLRGQEALKKAMEQYALRIRGYRPARSSSIIDPGQTDLMKKLNPLNYEKGAWVLHMLRGLLGDEIFFEGIRNYYQLFQGGNASSDDFRKAMESTSGRQLELFFKQWLYQPGWPEYGLSWRWIEGEGNLEISIRQNQDNGLFDMPVEFAVLTGDKQETIRYKFRINNAAHRFQIPLKMKPMAVEIDPEGWVLKTVSKTK
jgi:aminopeptidase N